MLVLQPCGELARMTRRQRIVALQSAMEEGIQRGELIDVMSEVRIEHQHIDGVYIRTMHLPAGRAIVGKIHKHNHCAILQRGRVTVFTEWGREELEGPQTFTSPAGVKRGILAHTDTVWTTIHATDETDLDRIEEQMIAKSYADFDAFAEENEAMLTNRVLQ
ncbi:hypothetical protein A8M77_15475 [Variovorax sp. JS1663]|nr:hypothetical protein A8M77_15475 [Variovorax sp. JS1663]